MGNQRNINKEEGDQQDSNVYSIGCNVMLLANKEFNDTANHSIEYQQRRKESIRMIQFIFNQMQYNATVIKGGFDMDGQPIEYQQRRRNQQDYNAYSIGCNVMLLEYKVSNDIANHSKEYHNGRREFTKNKEAVSLLTIQSNINRGEGNQ